MAAGNGFPFRWYPPFEDVSVLLNVRLMRVEESAASPVNGALLKQFNLPDTLTAPASRKDLALLCPPEMVAPYQQYLREHLHSRVTGHELVNRWPAGEQEQVHISAFRFY